MSVWEAYGAKEARAELREKAYELARLGMDFPSLVSTLAKEAEYVEPEKFNTGSNVWNPLDEGVHAAMSVAKYAADESLRLLGMTEQARRDLLGADMPDPNGPDSWEFIDAVQEGAKPVAAPFLGGVVYEAARHLVSGESGCGKSWYALWLVSLELRDGHPVVWIDTDDMGASRVLARLRAFGVSDDTIAADFLLVRPSRPATDEAIERVVAAITERGVRLVVLDSFNPALGLDGLDPLKTTDLDKWIGRYSRPIVGAGAALLVLDHVPKGHDNQRGGYAYGAERKRSGFDVQLSMKPEDAFGMGKVGRARLTVEKDRDGHIGPRGTVVGRFEMHATHEGDRVTPRMDSEDTAVDRKMTGYMERVSLFLEDEPEPVYRAKIENAELGKAEHVRKALDDLVALGFVSAVEGARKGTRQYVSARPYREGDEWEPEEDV